MESIRSTVSFLEKLSATASLSDGIGQVRQKVPMTVFHVSDIVLQAFSPTKALHAGLGVLFVVGFS